MDEIKEAVGTDGYVVEVSTSDKKIRWGDEKCGRLDATISDKTGKCTFFNGLIF